MEIKGYILESLEKMLRVQLAVYRMESTDVQ